MRSVLLKTLNARFIGAGGDGVFNADGSPAPVRTGVGVIMDCPCGCDSPLYVPFSNPLDGGQALETKHHTWHRIESTIERLTLAPSVLRGEPCPSRWHGFIIDGEARQC